MYRKLHHSVFAAVLGAGLAVTALAGCDQSDPNACPIDYNQDGHVAWDEGLKFLTDQGGQQTLATSRDAQQACMSLSTDIDQFIKK